MNNDAKKRYWRKKYDAAQVVPCECGCGRRIKTVDQYGRPRRFMSGHNNRKYKDVKEYQRQWRLRNKEARYGWKKARWRRLKVKLIEAAFGQCYDCGVIYDGTNAAIFHFHHRDPSTKSFTIGNQLVNRAWKKILAEVEKCDMICANCHEMKHGEPF